MDNEFVIEVNGEEATLELTEEEMVGNAIGTRARSVAEKRALGLTHKQIAELHGVSTKTVQRALERPEVRELVDETQSEMFDESTAALLALFSGAVETIGRLMNSESDSVAIRAASKTIDTVGPLVGHRVKEQRLQRMVESIESAVADL